MLMRFTKDNRARLWRVVPKKLCVEDAANKKPLTLRPVKGPAQHFGAVVYIFTEVLCE